jgi:hypothetical protein
MFDVGEWHQRTQSLMDDRMGYERVWNDIIRYVYPMGPRLNQYGVRWASTSVEAMVSGSKAASKAPEIYDSTSIWAIDRLGTGVESLITPKTTKWHDLAIDDPLAGEASDQELIWLDTYRNSLFASRYDVRSGFLTANQKAIKSACALGTGVYMVEEKFGIDRNNERRVPITYRYIPLNECFICVDYKGMPCGLHRVYEMTALQAYQFFGDKTPAKVMEAYNNPKDRGKRFMFVHAVEQAYGNDRYNRMDFVSLHYCMDTKEAIHKSGFHEFPYVVYYWMQDETNAYGESPVMLAISEIRSLNLLTKHANRAAQQWTDPPTASLDDSIVNQPNLNPGKNNPGYLDPDTHDVLLKPLITAQNPTFVEAVLASKKDQVNETLYVKFWQMLIQNREMTATEALIRANEKGELIGPIGDSMQTGQTFMFNREHAILLRRGAFDPPSKLAPPDSMRGKSFGPKFNSQYDRMRRASELIGTERLINTVNLLAPIRPDIKHRLDVDFILRHTQEVGGAPARALRPLEEAQKDIDAENQMMQASQAAAIAEQGGKAANEIIPAMGELQGMAPELQQAMANGAAPQ